MKRVEALAIATAVAGLMAASCSGDNVERPPPPPVNWQAFNRPPADAGSAVAPTPKETLIAQEYLSALASPALAKLGLLFDTDAHASFPGMDDALDRDGAVRTHTALFGAIDQRRFVATRVWRTAGEQTVEWVMSGVQNADWMGVTATHKPLVIKGITLLWTNDDGTIEDAHVSFDVAAAKVQLGAGPKELAALTPPVMPTEPTQFFDAPPQQPDLLPVVRTALDAFENTAEAAYAAQMDESVEINTLERTDAAHGKEAQLAYFKMMHKSIAQLDATVQNGWSVGTYAIVEYTLAGEQLAPIGWVPLQRDRVIKKHNIDIDEVRDGRIVRVWRYDNPSELLIAGP